MLVYPLSVLGLLVSVGLLVQLAPAATNNMNMRGLRIAFAGEPKLGVVALHCFWGAACLLIALEVTPSALPLRIALGRWWP